MIDWRIQKGGCDIPGDDPRLKGSWFPDFDHQQYLLPFFDVGETPIDEYGRTEFLDGDLRRLRTHLSYWRPVFEAKPTTWTVTESGPHGCTTIHLDRVNVLSIIDCTLEMIELALKQQGILVFFGD
jgi:hypothetical protein